MRNPRKHLAAVTLGNKKPAEAGYRGVFMFSGIVIAAVLIFWYQFIFKDGFNRDRFYAFLFFTGLPFAGWLIL
ncbi:hypothetical protein V5043_23515 [Enterobacter kobei]|uniref:hypothetical protein n=1 Tax=Enterobacter kobei TaxID=208224 RepID=UPI0026EFB91E|nr:hypothetical protein [Enterobacter kobei]